MDSAIKFACEQALIIEEAVSHLSESVVVRRANRDKLHNEGTSRLSLKLDLISNRKGVEEELSCKCTNIAIDGAMVHPVTEYLCTIRLCAQVHISL